MVQPLLVSTISLGRMSSLGRTNDSNKILVEPSSHEDRRGLAGTAKNKLTVRCVPSRELEQMSEFKLDAPFKPTGDQPQAIEKLVEGLESGLQHQTLLGVTGSGKTFSMANVIEAYNKPTLVISHNKTLAAQLTSEYKQFFPDAGVEYFVSYYDYYQPEAYVPSKDMYIEKEADINREIERLRHSSTHSLRSRKDVVVVASVSCIYGVGNPSEYDHFRMYIEKGNQIDRREILERLVAMQSQKLLVPQQLN